MFGVLALRDMMKPIIYPRLHTIRLHVSDRNRTTDDWFDIVYSIVKSALGDQLRAFDISAETCIVFSDTAPPALLQILDILIPLMTVPTLEEVPFSMCPGVVVLNDAAINSFLHAWPRLRTLNLSGSDPMSSLPAAPGSRRRRALLWLALSPPSTVAVAGRSVSPCRLWSSRASRTATTLAQTRSLRTSSSTSQSRTWLSA